MRVRIKAGATGDGRWYAEASGLRGFGVSPVLGATRKEAIDKSVSAVLVGLSYALERGHVKRPRGVVFVVAGGDDPGPRPRRHRAGALQVFSP